MKPGEGEEKEFDAAKYIADQEAFQKECAVEAKRILDEQRKKLGRELTEDEIDHHIGYYLEWMRLNKREQ